MSHGSLETCHASLEAGEVASLYFLWDLTLDTDKEMQPGSQLNIMRAKVEIQ